MERRLISLHIPSLRKLLGCINKELYEKKESVANHEGWRFMAIYVRDSSTKAEAATMGSSDTNTV